MNGFGLGLGYWQSRQGFVLAMSTLSTVHTMTNGGGIEPPKKGFLLFLVQHQPADTHTVDSVPQPGNGDGKDKV